MLALALGRATAMARAPAGLPAGIRLSDHVSLGVVARTFPIKEVRRVLAETGKASERERDLPAHVMVYYAIALAFYAGAGTREVLRCLLEGLRWLWGAEAVRVAGKSGISQARTRLGAEPLRRLYDQVVRPIATPATKGAWHRGWRWSAWTAPASTSPTRRRMAPPSDGQAPAVARVPFRSSASWPWSRTARTCCSALAWAALRRARRPWRTTPYRRSGRVCCAWPTGSSSATRSGRRPL